MVSGIFLSQDLLKSSLPEEGYSVDFWQKTAQAVYELGSKPGAICIGSLLGLGLVASTAVFVGSFFSSDENSSLQNRVIAGFNLTGSLARFSSWVHAEIFWQVGGAIVTDLLGGIGATVGFLRSGVRACEALGEIQQTARFVEQGERVQFFERPQFYNSQIIHILNYTSHILFASFCVVGLASLAVGGALFPPIAGALILGSVFVAICAFFMRLGNGEENRNLRLLESNDLGRDRLIQ